jgi:hypothetical protein
MQDGLKSAALDKEESGGRIVLSPSPTSATTLPNTMVQ